MHQRFLCLPLVQLAVLLLLTAGCGSDRPDTYPVHGRVTFDGQPVTTGRIMFYPEEGRAAFGSIEADGSYRLTTFDTGDGALPGKHTVTIKAVGFSGAATQAKSVEDELTMDSGLSDNTGKKPPQWIVPKEYSERSTSPVQAEVEPKDNEVNFDLAAP